MLPLISLAQDGDSYAEGVVMEHHKGLVERVCSRLGIPRDEWGDYLSVGQMAMRKPIQRYDPKRGVPLWGYAYHFVRGAIIRRRGYLFGLRGKQIDHYKRVRSLHRALVERNQVATVTAEAVAENFRGSYGTSVSAQLVRPILVAAQKQQIRRISDEGELDRLALHFRE